MSRAKQVKITQASISKHLGLATPNVCNFLKKNDIKPPYNLDSIRLTYIEDLRSKASGRYTEGNLDPLQERARKDAAMADKYERENQVEEGKLVEIEKIEIFVSENNHRAKQKLLKLPRELATSVPQEFSIEIQKISSEKINEVLEELSQYNG